MHCPKIFGIGMSRTGTKSLSCALHQLGFQIAHFPDDEVTFQELSIGNYQFSILNKLDGITDITVAYFYPQLDRLLPDSKFILTVRNKQDWLNSVESHWAKHPCFNDPNRQRPEDQTHMAVRQLLCATIYGSYKFNRERASYIYDLHYNNVNDYFADRPEDLLILDICSGEGWQKLCHFLNKPLQTSPFPQIRDQTDPQTLTTTTDRSLAMV
ncbi:MAG: sulfotransferase family protein [Cyanobacteria bacterium P01_F01_bin.86]